MQGLWSNRTAWAMTVLIVAFHGMDMLLMGNLSPWTLGFRLLWALTLMTYSTVIANSSSPWERFLSDLHVALITICMLGIVMFTGGTRSAYFLLVVVLPMANCLIYRRGARAALLSGILGALGTFVLSWKEHLGWESLFRLCIVLTVTLFTTYLAEQVRLTQGSEQEMRLERARRESLELLAVSEHRRAQTEKLAALGRLASEVAHEINNPLAYVGANVDFVRDAQRRPGETSPEELIEVLDQTSEGLRHIRQIVADLKSFARMDTQEPTECVLADVVGDALKLASLRLKHVARLRVEVPVDLPVVVGVRQRLVQVVINLLVNAGDALEEHGVREGEVWVRGFREQGHAVLLIEDNGPGFPPHVLSRLFEPFFTTKGPEKGTGLGLNLSRDLVAQFGGVLTATNRPEGGARLRIEFHKRAE